MTLDEFYSLSKEECFERLKAESRAQAKQRLCGGVVITLLILAAITYIVLCKPEEFEYYTNSFYICLLSVLGIAAVWFAVNNLRFLLLVDSLDAPKHLLHWYDKMIKNNRNALCLLVLVLIISFYPGVAYHFKYFDLIWTLTDLTFKVALVALWIYLFFKFELSWGYKTRRDEEIIDRLQDLIDMK